MAWRQWRTVGAQTSAKARGRALVDPEALVLLSLTLMEHERRLADVLVDWMAWNSDLLSVQRMKNLVTSYPESTRDRLGWLAGVALKAGKDLRWRPLAKGAEHAAAPKSGRLRGKRERAVRARLDRKSTRLNSSHIQKSRMPSSA